MLLMLIRRKFSYTKLFYEGEIRFKSIGIILFAKMFCIKCNDEHFRT